jgi:hypothetical protein
MMRRVSEATTTPRSRFGRRHLVAALTAVLLVGAGAAAWAVLSVPSHHDLESTVKRVSAPGATHPLRVDRWGTRFCRLPIPMNEDCANSDLLYDSRGVPAEQYRRQWQAALGADGWTRHVDQKGNDPQRTWWTRDKVAVALTTQGDSIYGPYFHWGAGELVVTARHVGSRSGELPGPGHTLTPG